MSEERQPTVEELFFQSGEVATAEPTEETTETTHAETAETHTEQTTEETTAATQEEVVAAPEVKEVIKEVVKEVHPEFKSDKDRFVYDKIFNGEEEEVYKLLHEKYGHKNMTETGKLMAYLAIQNQGLDDDELSYIAAKEYGIGLQEPNDEDATDEEKDNFKQKAIAVNVCLIRQPIILRNVQPRLNYLT